MVDSFRCCVCLTDESTENNSFIHCNGTNCSTIVHKICRGSQHISVGQWFCQKCTYHARSAQRCELCPSTDGMLARTDKGGWCHIVCALFMPGVEFLDGEKLETVSINKVPSDKFNKICSICVRNNRLECASTGACIQCNTVGCDAMLHVTCGQSEGLLKESLSQKEDIRHVAYCAMHVLQSTRHNFTLHIKTDKSKLRAQTFEGNIVNRSGDISSFMSSDSPSENDSSAVEIGTNLKFKKAKKKNDSSAEEIGTNLKFRKAKKKNDSSAEEIGTNLKFRKAKKKNGVDKSLSMLNPITKLRNSSMSSNSKSRTKDNLPSSRTTSDVSTRSTQDVFPDTAKEECSVTYNPFSSYSSNNDQYCGANLTLSATSKRLATTDTFPIPQKLEKLLKTEQIPSINDKATKLAIISKAVKARIENRVNKKMVAPSLPKSVVDHMNNVVNKPTVLTTPSDSVSSTMTMSKNCGVGYQSMEDLLEWQWDQTGGLLMQHAEANDIACLLSCLHDLKNENEELLSKQLKLITRRDHLKAINSKLQLQLLHQPNEIPINQSTNTHTNAIVPTINQHLPRPTNKATIDSASMTQYKQVRPRLITDSHSSLNQQSSPMWSQSSTPANQPKLDIQLNEQSIAFLKLLQQNQEPSTPVSVSNVLSHTDLVALLNKQLYSQLSNHPQSITNHQQRPNNGTNMNILYKALQPNYQSPATVNSSVYYQTSSEVPSQSGKFINFNPAFMTQKPDNSSK